MSVRWTKLGRVYGAAGESAWRQTHAFVPTTIAMDDDRIRVFVAFMDAAGVGRIGWVDVDARDPTRVLGVSERPALDVGLPGRFDDNGVNPLSVLRLDDGTLRLYYTGWQLGVHVRYFLFTGAAESRDGGESFQRVSEVPVLERSDGEAAVRTGGYVVRDGGAWRMWYAGGSEWVTGEDGTPRPVYDLRHVASSDGITWPRQGAVVMTPRDDEHGFGRPAVVADGGLLRMWPSVRFRDRGYRIGYAESEDGLRWERRDGEAGIDVSATGWDSEMVCMASIERTPHGAYLFYNGNGYGRTGFGVAVTDDL